MTEIRDLIEQRYRDLLASAFRAAPVPLPDLLDDPDALPQEER
jgi:hypothetical protein